ncbi:MAG TPA: hypothetical protein VGF55_10405 [Gemmataceae bacterium]
MRRRAFAWLPAAAVIAVFAGDGRADPPPAAEPPRLLAIIREESRPAYQFYLPPPGGRPADLRGHKQRVRGAASLDGDRTVIDTTAGAEVVLIALTDRPLTAARVLPAGVKAEVTADRGTKAGLVRVRLPNVRGTVPFVLEFTAADGTTGRRPVTVRAAADQVPAVDAAVAVVRNLPQGYLVTPSALIPFTATARDDHGLDRLAYVLTATRLDAAGKAVGPEREQTVPVGGFAQLLRQRDGTGLPIRDFRITADDAASALDLGKLPHLFRETDANAPPSRYRLQVRLEATDNDVETGPHTRNCEPVTFVVVSELELLAEVARAEDWMRLTLESRGADSLRRAQAELRRLNDRLAAAKPDQFPDLVTRADDAAAAVERAAETVRDIHAGFRDVVTELKANRVRAEMIERVEKTVCGPLDEVLRRDFTRTADAVAELSRRLDGDDAGQTRKAAAAAGKQVDDLIRRLQTAVDATHELDQINRLLAAQLESQRNLDRLLWDRP